LTHKHRFEIVIPEKASPYFFITCQEILLKNELDQAPFSFLPEKEKKDLLSLFSSETIKKDTILLVQEISSIDKLLILSQGSARYYFEQNNEKTLQGRLNEGDNFGGISILLNDAVAIRTLKVLEDSAFLCNFPCAFTQELHEVRIAWLYLASHVSTPTTAQTRY
jgi:signal-transduction protein with cAMP-binding, CBS, and nucleotidyltransferase domain